MRLFISSFCLSLFLLFTACDNNRIFEEYAEIPDKKWSYDNSLPFTVTITDTVQRYHVSVNLRHTNSYPYQNLWIKIITTYPSGKRLENRVDLPLANKAGKWHGSGLGDIINASIDIQKNARLPELGKYQFDIIQDMRMNPLPEILDIGIRVEKAIAP